MIGRASSSLIVHVNDAAEGRRVIMFCRWARQLLHCCRRRFIVVTRNHFRRNAPGPGRRRRELESIWRQTTGAVGSSLHYWRARFRLRQLTALSSRLLLFLRARAARQRRAVFREQASNSSVKISIYTLTPDDFWPALLSGELLRKRVIDKRRDSRRARPPGQPTGLYKYIYIYIYI